MIILVIILVVVATIIVTYSWLYHSSLPPLIKTSDAHHLTPSCHSCFPPSLIIPPTLPLCCVPAVPSPDPGVHITRPNTGYKQQGESLGKTSQVSPVLPVCSIRKSGRGKVSIKPIKASCFNVISVFELHKKTEEHSIQVCSPY